MYKKFFQDLGIKVIKTFFQSLAGAMTTAVLLQDVDWKYALGAAALAALYCAAFNIGSGLPDSDSTGDNLTTENESTEEAENNELKG